MKKFENKCRRGLALILSLVMCLGMLAVPAFAAEGDGLCAHHPEHTSDCGYAAAVEGADCTHVHDDKCGYAEAVPGAECDKGCTDTDGDGVIDHAEDCGYTEAQPEAACTHVHDEGCGYVEAVEARPCAFECKDCELAAMYSNYGYDYDYDNDGVCDSWNISAAQSSNDEIVYAYLIESDNPAYYTLVIDGMGPMKDFSFDWDTPAFPWKDFRSQICEISVGDQVTRIGNYFLTWADMPVYVLDLSTCVSLKEIGILYDCGVLETVICPASLEKIGSFNTSTRLKTIDISRCSKLEFGSDAFAYCSALETIDLSNLSMETLPNTMFYGCANLKEIKLPSGLKSTGYQVFSGKSDAPWTAPCLDNGTILLPDGLEEIGLNTFAGNKHLSHITLPATLTTIKPHAFANTSLIWIYIPASVKGIDQYAFIGLPAGSILYLEEDSSRYFKPSGNGADYNYSADMTALAIVNGGIFPEETQFELGKLAAPVRHQYEFEGWYTDADFTGEKVETLEIDADGKYPTYYAKWSNEESLNYQVRTTLPFGAKTYGTEMAETITVAPLGNETETVQKVECSNSKIFTVASEGSTVTVTPAAGLPAGYYAERVYVTTADGVCHFVYVTLTVNRAKYDMSGVTFADQTIPYDGQAHTLEIKGDLPEGVEVSYSTNTLTSVGTLEVVATFTGADKMNYEPIPQRKATLTILPADPTEVSFASGKFIYDGTAKSLAVTGLPEGVSVTYEGNGQMEAGIYTVTAKFNSTGNYNAPAAKTATLTINKAQPQLTLTPSNVSLTGGGEVALTVTGVPEGGTVELTCDNGIVVTGNKAVLPNSDATYTFTANYAGDKNHAAASAACTVSVTRVEPPHEHTWGDWTVVVPATCGAGGADSRTCRDDKTHVELRVTQATGNHTWNAGVVTTQPTTASEGERTYTCTVCGATRTERMDRLPVEPILPVIPSYPTGGGSSSGGTSNRPSTGTPAETIPDAPTPLDPGTTDITDQDVPLASVVLPFGDVNRGVWYRDAVAYVFSKNLMNGTSDTVFAPELSTQRGMIVTILHRLEGTPAAAAAAFADVKAGQWYADAVSWGAANGIVEGYSDTEFAPLRNITREQLAAILYRYAQSKGYDTGKRADLSGYADASSVSAYALEAMRWAVAEGLITGKTATTLVPGGEATRAEVAMILMRFCENVAVKAETQSLPDGI